DIERVQVWNAISEFYLDTSQDAKDIERIAQILARSPFSIDELRHIEFCEVEPTCYQNLWSMAGEWAGFSPDWLIPRCLERQRKNPYKPIEEQSWFFKFVRSLFFGNIPITRINEIRATPSGTTV